MVWYLSDPRWPPPNLAMLNAALEQSSWQGAAMTPVSWRQAIRSRLDALDWHGAAEDVRPFLDRPEDVALVNKEAMLRLLAEP